MLAWLINATEIRPWSPIGTPIVAKLAIWPFRQDRSVSCQGRNMAQVKNMSGVRGAPDC